MILSVLLTFFVLSAGCSDPIANYYPLKVGNEWRFQTSYPLTGEEREDVELIVRRFENTFHLNNGESLIHFRNHGILNKNGVYILRLPLRAGYSWIDQGVQLEITQTDKVMDVPAGRFSRCVEVTWDSIKNDRKFQSVITYAPKVGPVCYEYFELGEQGNRSLLLSSKLKRFIPAEKNPKKKE